MECINCKRALNEHRDPLSTDFDGHCLACKIGMEYSNYTGFERRLVERILNLEGRLREIDIIITNFRFKEIK